MRFPRFAVRFALLGCALLLASCGGGSKSTSGATPTPTPTPTRDPLKWPFASTSIWNMPIGSGAVYVPAHLPAIPGGGDPSTSDAPMPTADLEYIFLNASAPVTPVYLNNARWILGRDRCFNSSTGDTTTTILTSVPIPASYVVPGTRGNNGAVFLGADGRTLTNLQPLTRCIPGEPATALLVFPTPEDLYGTGITGAHGGSKLSTLGGTLRVGELRRNGQPPHHALKIDVDTREVFPKRSSQSDCYRWPALSADGGAVNDYGSLALPNASSAMKMGALLALPASLDLNTLGLETEPGRQLAWTLQNYGGYIVDSTGGSAYYLAAENGPDGNFTTQFEADWGYSFTGRVKFNTPWVRDIQKLFTALQVVDNNGPTSIGGGGTPRQPLAPSL